MNLCLRLTSHLSVVLLANYELKFIIDHDPSQGGRATFGGGGGGGQSAPLAPPP